MGISLRQAEGFCRKKSAPNAIFIETLGRRIKSCILIRVPSFGGTVAVIAKECKAWVGGKSRKKEAKYGDTENKIE